VARQAAAGLRSGDGESWCAAQIWLGSMAQFSGDMAAGLGHFTAVYDAVADRAPSRALTRALANRAAVLLLMGRAAEANADARRAVTLAREIGTRAGSRWPWATSVSAPIMSAIMKRRSGWPGRPGRSPRAFPAGSPGIAAPCCVLVTSGVAPLTAAGPCAGSGR